MNTVLVTGGAGFIGSCLVRHLLAGRRARVVNLDLLTYAGNRASLADIADDPNHIFAQGDIGDEELVARLLAEHRPTAIFNLAAESHVDRSIDSPRRFVETNIVGTFQLLEQSRLYWRALGPDEQETFRFVHVSSDEVFGSLDSGGEFDEQSPYAPNSPYAASKASSDHLVRAYHQTYGLPTIITNSSNNYGPYQFPEKLVPLMILNALDGKPLPIYGSGQQVRDWLHVADHAVALQAVWERGRPGEVYCIGGDCTRTNLEVVKAICAAVDTERGKQAGSCACDLIEHVADRPGHDQRYAIDATKIKNQLDWAPTIDFPQGIAQTVRWYIEHRDWATEVMAGVYDRRRLGLGD